jgi:sulfopyruvate decarboxylase subunit alpha
VFLSGKRAALITENSGLRAATEQLARLGLGAGIPVIMVMSYRGELGQVERAITDALGGDLVR